ncbi:transcriptional regulator NrdR [Caloranaerobacter sp. DY30410]|uniref:transcriptional regulator NrdR n=1 Tax=Caloranaerobacter sp. DY30410 TaxID=3238305 RepID=UPI003CFE37AF
MKCPYCNYFETKVVDSRPTDEGQAIRRRRECVKCNNRFTTYEKVEEIPLIVVKKDGTRQEYSRDKILNGIIRACEKRPVSLKTMENIVDEIEKNLYNTLKREISTEYIGEMVMNKLKDIDEVAYVRFASVYRQFKDINTFMDELKKLLDEKKQVFCKGDV